MDGEKIYYRIDGDTCYYNNEQLDERYQRCYYYRPWGGDPGPQVGKYLVLETQPDGKFYFPMNCEYMFEGILNSTIDLSMCVPYDGNSISAMNMFRGCPNLTEVKMPETQIYWGNYMFSECPKLKKVDLSDVDLSTARNLVGMFKSCPELEEIIFGENCTLDSLPSDTFSYGDAMFNDCQSLSSIKFPPGTNWDDYDIDNGIVFKDCPSLEGLEDGTGDLSNCNNVNSRGVFNVKIDLYYRYSIPYSSDSMRYARVYYSNTKYDSRYKLWTPDSLTDVYGQTINSGIVYEIEDGSSVVYLPEDSRNIFRNCFALANLGSVWQWEELNADFSKFDPRYTKNLSYAFYGNRLCHLTGLAEWDVSNVEDMSYMFAKMPDGFPCREGSSSYSYTFKWKNQRGTHFNSGPDPWGHHGEVHHVSEVKNWRVSKVKTFESFMDGSYNIDYRIIWDMANWNVEACSNFRRMFAFPGPTSAATGTFGFNADLSKWKSASSNVDCSQMFYKWYASSSLILPKTFIDPSIFKNVDKMFYDSNFDSISVVDDTDWADNPNISGYQMFYNCTSLNTFDSTKTDILKANTYTGYFNQVNLMELMDQTYFKTNSGWKESTPYIKTNDGWKLSEVYR